MQNYDDDKIDPPKLTDFEKFTIAKESAIERKDKANGVSEKKRKIIDSVSGTFAVLLLVSLFLIFSFAWAYYWHPAYTTWLWLLVASVGTFAISGIVLFTIEKIYN